MTCLGSFEPPVAPQLLEIMRGRTGREKEERWENMTGTVRYDRISRTVTTTTTTTPTRSDASAARLLACWTTLAPEMSDLARSGGCGVSADHGGCPIGRGRE